MQNDAGFPHGFFRHFSTERHHLAAALCALLLLAAYGRSNTPAPTVFSPPIFSSPAATTSPVLPADARSSTLPGSSASVSAPSLAALPDGRMAAVWLGEGHGAYQADQAIWFSTLDERGWRESFALTTREEAAGHTLSHLSGISRPQLLAHAERLDLWFNAHGPGLGERPGIYAMTSYDAGQSWSAPRRLPVSPWLQGGLHFAQPPLALADGGSILPLAPAPAERPRFWLRLNADGQALARAPADGPAAAGLPGRLASDALLPGHGPRALLPLADGRLLLAGAADPQGSELWLWLGEAQGKSWQAQRRIASAPPTPEAASSLSDPRLQTTPDGRIHLVYVWRGQVLQHLAFTAAWLDGRENLP